MTNKQSSGLILATAAAALFVSGAALAGGGQGTDKNQAKEATVHCSGINACKGKAECKTAHNACAGQNACKGKGHIRVTKEECDAKGGKVVEG